MSTVRGIASTLALLTNTVLLCIPLFLLGTARLAIRGPWRTTLWRWMDADIQIWVAGNRWILRTLSGVRMRVHWHDDAGLSRQRWYLVISNHQSWADILVLQNALWGRIPMIKFFTKRQLIWVPIAGLAMWFLGFPYVRRLPAHRIAADPSLAELDRQATLDACSGFRDHPTTVLSFLEGTRFTAAKHAAQAARFRCLLNPKLGGVSYVMDAMRDRIHRILDVTIVYRGDVPSFRALLEGRCRDVDVQVHCREMPASVNAARDAAEMRECLRPWIESLWQDKDRHLTELAN